MNLLDMGNNFELRHKVIYLESKIDSLFRLKEKLTLTEIKNYLLEQKYAYTEEELNYAIHSLYINRGFIVRDYFFDHEPIYTRLDRRLELSSYSKHYYSFKVDNYETKKILLIADTHIGNEKLEDFKLLDKVYEYAINNGANKCMHLGDLFTGNIIDDYLTAEEKLKQLKRFIDYYPKPLPSEMMTYGVLGNNDLEIDDMLWHDGFSSIFYDLRELSFVNPSFYMIPRERWTTTFLDKNFHFGHKFHHSMLIHDLRITCEEDLIENRRWLDPTYDVHVSGHLHTGLIYGAGPSKYVDKDQLFLSVPATGKINLNKPVAYLVTLNYSDTCDAIPSMDVSILTCDNNYKISELDNLTWNFNGNNDINKRIRVL